MLLILRELNNNFKKQSEEVEAQNQRIEQLASKLDSLYEDYDQDDCYIDESESQIEVEPLENEPL